MRRSLQKLFGREGDLMADFAARTGPTVTHDKRVKTIVIDRHKSFSLNSIATDGHMTGLQKFVVAILPKKWAASVEAESRSWIARCSSCGLERSIWNLGGIGWKAAGNPRRYLFCVKCGQGRWHTISKRQPPDS